MSNTYTIDIPVQETITTERVYKFSQADLRVALCNVLGLGLGSTELRIGKADTGITVTVIAKAYIRSDKTTKYITCPK